MRVLTEAEVEQVSGGATPAGWTNTAYVIMALGLSGGPATGAFGLLIGGSMLYVDYRLK